MQISANQVTSIRPEIIRKPKLFDDFSGNRSQFIHLNLLNNRGEIWHRSLSKASKKSLQYLSLREIFLELAFF